MLKEAVDDVLHNPRLFTLPQIARLLEGWGHIGIAQALRERIDALEKAMGWIRTS